MLLQYCNMRVEHLVFHIPRCGGTAVSELLKLCTVGPFRRDATVDGEITVETVREGEHGIIMVSQDPQWLERADNVYIILRDPVARAVSLYNHLEDVIEKHANSDASIVGWHHKSFEDYLGGDQLESNWITRALSCGGFQGECTDEMYHHAIMRLCSSSVHTLDNLPGLVDRLRRNGVRMVKDAVVNKFMREKTNASKRTTNLEREQVERLMEVNQMDCKLWDIGQLLAKHGRI